MANWLQTWFDALCDVMSVTGPDGKQVTSFYIFKREDYPQAISPEQIPCVVNYITNPELQYSEGGPNIILWNGQSEFHLTTDVKPSNIPFVIKFFEIIIRACAGKMQLSGTVAYFCILQNTKEAIQFITYRNPEGRDDHQGIILQWQVKQLINSDLVVSR